MTVSALVAGLGGLAVLALGAAVAPGGRRSWSGLHRPEREVGSVASGPAVVLGVLLAAGAAVVIGAVGVVTVVGVLAGGAWARRWVPERRRRAALDRALPDLVDLFAIAASAGHPPPSVLRLVAARSPPACASAVRAALRRFDAGLPLADSLHALAADLDPGGGSLAGETGRALVAALLQAATSGAPLAPLLDGVAVAARDQQRRRAEERARRLPVTLLFPLVCCTLPAAVLLAVVPVLVVSIGSLAP